MKNLIKITVAFFFLWNTTYSQDNQTDNRELLQFGGKMGLSYSNVYDSGGEEFNSDPKFGLTGGVFLMIPIGKYLGIQPEIMLTQKGFKGSGIILGNNYDFIRTTGFLEVPILFAFKPSEFITLLAGPQYSYLLTQRDEFNSSAYSYFQEQEFKQENIRKNLFGFMGGVNINLRHLVIGGRIGWDIQNNKGDGTSSTPKYKNVCIQFTGGYQFYR